MKRFIKNLFSCHHKNALITGNEGFCPDCGKYLKKYYYVIRCSNCGIKRSIKKNFNVISPREKFCTCCGSNEFVIEKYEKLNFSDINYAIEAKEVIEHPDAINELEIWIDENKTPEKKETKSAPLLSEVKYITG